ncbi:ion transporter [Zunongwangia sp. F363]|uniref:Ion transporter n=1 Tax=Autumnicola tepida TaxID=3075595 RepID=A0ABU3C5L2_9FLAO|nr:ion transporter [Zunongwangia sp. F363]MDT0641636.1 ion transporter [Zunongwangia sp. F363]
MSGLPRLKHRVYSILKVSRKPGDASWNFDVFIIILIVGNVAAMLLESIEPIRLKYSAEFKLFEIFSVTIFSLEYILRIWTANISPAYPSPVKGRLKYALSPLALVDLLAILPFFLPFVGVDLRLLRVLRIFRIFRVFKIARYVTALALMNRVVSQKKEELVLSLIFTLSLLLITSTLMYYIENEAQPENFSSIPETMWWGIATLTTVGYGDIYPVTPLGQFMGGVIAVIGIGLFALPTGILASGFSEELTNRKEKINCCPTCGRPKIQEYEI